MTAVIVGLLGSLVGGTFASFTAQTTNGASTFATGTLVLSDSKSGGTTCLSTGGGNTDTNANSTGCDSLINGSVRKPGDSTSSVVAIADAGSIGAATSELWSSACANSDAAGESYHGTGLPCGTVQLTIHDDTNNRCIYPTTTFGVAQAGACTPSATKTLADFATNSNAAHIALGALAAGSSVSYTITATLPATAGNNMQGRTASIDFNWKLNQ